MNRKILLAEDDINLGNILRNYLTAKYYETTLFTSGKSAYDSFKSGLFDLCILDIMMPEVDGLSLAKAIRRIEPGIPLIFLTAKNQEDDVIEGFKSGADDYITKPFSMEELIYRIEAIFKRVSGRRPVSTEGTISIGNYIFDRTRQVLIYKDKTTTLTTKESELLDLLSRNKNEVLERNYALRTIWIDDNYFNARSMDVYITRLRKYLREDSSVKILNIHGKGYRLIC
jgi:two-component system OmpR family response regulator